MSNHQPLTEPPEELLLSRVADRTATPSDWAALTTRAQADSALWQRLGATLRDECLLQAAMRGDASAATAPPFAAIDQATTLGGRRRHSNDRPRTQRPLRTSRKPTRAFRKESVRALVALGAVLGVFWFGYWFGGSRPLADRSAATQTAVEPTPPASTQLFARYLEQRSTEGGLVEQLPDLTLTSTATEDGRVEVLFLRRIVERTIVRDAWTMAIDEHGNPDPIRVPAIEAVAATNF